MLTPFTHCLTFQRSCLRWSPACNLPWPVTKLDSFNVALPSMRFLVQSRHRCPDTDRAAVIPGTLPLPTYLNTLCKTSGHCCAEVPIQKHGS